MKIEYYEDMLEQEAINKYLNMIANDYNGELAKIFEEKYINKDKEIERLNNIIKEVRELLKNDYFEDGSFTSQEKVFELLDKEKNK